MNRYIVGQVTLLLGTSAVMLMAFAPSAVGQFVGSHVELSWTGEMPEHAAALLRTCRMLSIVMALAGLVLSPIAYLRERPPLLPVVGGVLCVLALGWHYLVWTFYLLTLTVVVVLLIAPLGGLVHLFISSVISAIFGITKSNKKDGNQDSTSPSETPKRKRYWLKYGLVTLLLLLAGAALAVVFVRFRAPRFVRNWTTVQIGMSKEQVVCLLGQPGRKCEPPKMETHGKPSEPASGAAVGVASLFFELDEYWEWEISRTNLEGLSEEEKTKYLFSLLFQPSDEAFVVYFDQDGKVSKCRPPKQGPYASLYKGQADTK
jgi:hypothetical protein